MSKYILAHDVRELEEIPYHWRIDSIDIEDKIKELRKQIYELQNSRKKQTERKIFRIK